MIRRAPRPEIEAWTRDPFFRRFFDLWNDEEGFTNGSSWHPAMDLVEEQDRLVVEVELPGIEPQDVHIDLQGEVLTVHGERKQETEQKQGKFLKREQRTGAFRRTLQLPYPVQSDTVKAQYKNGVLTITLPKAEDHVGRHIQVEVEK